MTSKPRIWAVIPAAGTGLRMGADVPKQYLKIKDKCILEYVLECFCSHSKISGIVVALAQGDSYWPRLKIGTHEKIMQALGGIERCHSVLNGLKLLNDRAGPNDWVLVHDAARPCLRNDDLDNLIDTLNEHPVGGLLALPVRDTMKRIDADNEISETVNREGLWHALTPQMFRLGPLQQAIDNAIKNKNLVTDEAQAMELAGMKPKLVQGRADNIKITQHCDLALAEFYLSQQEMT